MWIADRWKIMKLMILQMEKRDNRDPQVIWNTPHKTALEAKERTLMQQSYGSGEMGFFDLPKIMENPVKDLRFICSHSV